MTGQSEVRLTRRQRRVLLAADVELRWRRYARDPFAFIEECLWVPAPTESGRARFVLYDYQRDGLEALLTSRFVVVLKARQLGWTTLAMAYALWKLLFRPGTNILLVSKDQRTADKALSQQLDFMWQHLDPELKARAPRVESWAAREHVFEFADGMQSRIVSLPATKTAGAGETATDVLWDEAALAVEQDDTFRTLMPTTDAGGKMLVFSTARGGHNLFARLVREARAGENGFRFLFYPWWVSRLINRLADVGGVDRTQYEEKRRHFKDEPWRLHAEYPETPDEALRKSGSARFADLPPEEEFVPFGFRGRIEEPQAGAFRLVADPQGPLRLRSEVLHGVPSWAVPVLSIDPAKGVGGDYTVFTLGWIDRDGIPVRAGMWRSNTVEAIDAARQADMLGRWACGSSRAALLVVELAGGWGDTFVNELRHHLHYPNLYVHRQPGKRSMTADTVFGFKMSYTQRPLVIDRLAEFVPSTEDPDRVVIDGICPDLRRELGAFVRRPDGKLAADVGEHDDIVMSTALWLYVAALQQPPRSGKATPGTSREGIVRHDLSEMLDGIERSIRAHERQQRRDGRRAARRTRRRQ